MTSPLRFCFLTTFYPPYSFGGDAIDVERMARALVARGHSVTVVHDVDAFRALSPKIPPARPSTNGIEVVSLRSRLGAVSALLTQQFGRPVVHERQLSALFRERTFDVVTFHNVSLVGGPGLLSLGGDAVRVYVAHEHWLVCPTHVLWRDNREACDRKKCLRCVVRYHRPPQLWRYTGWLERQLPHVDVFIARSEFSRRKHREFGFPRAMEVLPYFLPDAFVPPAKTSDPGAGSPNSRPYFLFVGRLERIKGLGSILPVFNAYQDADLLVVGDGSQAAALKAQAAGNPRVRFVGLVGNEDLGRYYHHAVATIVPSVGFETFGLVVIEAFRHRTPVIARRLGPFPELIDTSGGGELFETNDELVVAMRRLQAQPDYRNALGQRGHTASLSLWSEASVLDGFLAIVARAARARAARSGQPVPAWVN